MYLVLARHTESIWNEKGFWTGLTNVPLDDKGIFEARKLAHLIKDIPFDEAFTSALLRAQETLNQIKLELAYNSLPVTITEKLNERDYGDLTGQNKWDIEEKYGEEQFQKWRRGWDDAPPNGESLHNVSDRVLPYYTTHILPKIAEQKNILVVAHGNSLRALVKHLDQIPDTEVNTLEISIGQVYIYEISETGEVLNRETRGGRVDAPHER